MKPSLLGQNDQLTNKQNDDNNDEMNEKKALNKTELNVSNIYLK